VPCASVRFPSVITIDVSVAAETLTPVLPLTEPKVAVITVAAPTNGGGFVTAAPSPAEAPLATTLTTVASPVLQVAVLVRFWVDASVYVPVAVNCRNVPGFIVGIAGVTAIDFKAAAVTFSVVAPLIEPEAAVMVDVPCALVCARPALLIVAVVVDDEVHVAELVKSLVDPSV
jgi:hypothetical protein